MKKKKKRDGFVRVDILEDLVIGNEIIIRRVAKINAPNEKKIQVQTRPLDPFMAHLSYSVESNNIRDALNEAYRKYSENSNSI